MKLLSIIAICSLFLYTNAHVVYGDWEIVSDDVICPRPTSGDCAKAGTCCGQKVGTQRMTRTCEEDHCDDAMLSKTRPCRVRCGEVDANAYGAWERAGNCERPESGDCSADNTCCGQLKGTMKHSRACLSENGCEASTLERDFKCNVRCGFVNPCDQFPNPCENGGTCVKDGQSHSCTCTIGYSGHHCETCKRHFTSPTGKTFAEAKQYCTDNNAYLAGEDVRTLADRREVQETANLNGNRRGYWVDLAPVGGDVKGNWQFQKGTDMAGRVGPGNSFDSWPGWNAFNNGRSHPCGFLWSVKAPYGNSVQRGWNMNAFHDRSCTGRSNYALCEQACNVA